MQFNGQLTDGQRNNRCSVQAVVINYNGQHTIKRCLDSLSGINYNFCFDVVVIDNNSTDNSLEIAKSYDQVVLIEAGDNLGFGKANNLAFKNFNRKYYYLHNVDAYLTPSTLQAAVDCMEADEKIGILGLPLSYPDGSAQPFAFSRMTLGKKIIQILGLKRIVLKLLSNRFVAAFIRTPALRRSIRSISFGQDFRNLQQSAKSQQSLVREVDWVCGAAMVIRRETIDQIGMFDEAFFMYYEDEDFCRRASSAGFKICTIAALPVVHDCGWTLRDKKSKINEARLKSAQYFIKKHFGSTISYPLFRFLLLAAPGKW